MSSSATASSDFDEKWLEAFYKECGREVTLSHTTLNQLKNWAAAVVAVSMSSIGALAKRDPAASVGGLPDGTLVYVGAIVVYAFTLRFFMRAILAYVNLVRWNNLQSAIVATKLLPPCADAARDEALATLHRRLRELYFGWHAPEGLTRLVQLTSNLKLGFALLLALPLLVALLSVSPAVLASAVGRGVTAFAIGYTILEFADFARSPFFDTAEAAARRRKGRDEIFPTPITGVRFLMLWALNVAVSVAVALVPKFW